MQIRTEEDTDHVSVQVLYEVAFETSAEARLVDDLREQAQPVISLVAEEAGTIIGHILFSPVMLAGHPELKIMGLAPMAVLPDHQHRGIGSALVPAGLEQCRKLGIGGVVVLGHPGYYPRFDFRPASDFNIDCEYDIPQEAFMLLELEPGYLRNVSGTIHYHDAFSNL